MHSKVLALSSQFASRFALKRFAYACYAYSHTICRGDAIGIWSKNCLNWMLADLAANSQSLVSVSIYDTFGPRSASSQ